MTTSWHRRAGVTPNPVVTRQPRGRSGYLVSVVVDIVLLYVVQHLLDWKVPWVTAAWSDVVWAVNLSLAISIVANATLLVYDAPWFQNLVDFVTTIAALLAGYCIVVVFPFDFGPEWNPLAHLVATAMLLALGIATVVTAVRAIIGVLRAGWREVTEL